MGAKRKQRVRAPYTVVGLTERLKEVIDTFGHITVAASVIDRSEGALRKWLRGESEPSASDIRRLCEASGHSAEWFLFGTDLQGRCEQENRVLDGPTRLKSL
jgi:transcriptional regulator with XRE-family HTH domain